jgi:hypothetical protein
MALSDRQAYRQILRYPEDFSPSLFARDQETTARQLLQIAAGGLMAHPWLFWWESTE